MEVFKKLKFLYTKYPFQNSVTKKLLKRLNYYQTALKLPKRLKDNKGYRRWYTRRVARRKKFSKMGINQVRLQMKKLAGFILTHYHKIFKKNINLNAIKRNMFRLILISPNKIANANKRSFLIPFMTYLLKTLKQSNSNVKQVLINKKMYIFIKISILLILLKLKAYYKKILTT